MVHLSIYLSTHHAWLFWSVQMDFSYNFPAVRGIQAGREYYVSMVPLKLLPVFSRLMTKLCRLNVERKDESMNPVSLKSKSISWIIEQTMFFLHYQLP